MLRAWFGICGVGNKRKFARLISFSIFGIAWKESNRRAFDGLDTHNRMIVNRWAKECLFGIHRCVVGEAMVS